MHHDSMPLQEYLRPMRASRVAFRPFNMSLLTVGCHGRERCGVLVVKGGHRGAKMSDMHSVLNPEKLQGVQDVI